MKRIIDAVQDDTFAVVYHNCGAGTVAAAESIAALGAAGYHFGNAIDMADILPLMPKDALVMGNVDPAGEVRNGTPKACARPRWRFWRNARSTPTSSSPPVATCLRWPRGKTSRRSSPPWTSSTRNSADPLPQRGATRWLADARRALQTGTRHAAQPPAGQAKALRIRYDRRDTSWCRAFFMADGTGGRTHKARAQGERTRQREGRGPMARTQLILDRYRPIAKAGAGGFGTVQVAWTRASSARWPSSASS